MSERVEYKDFHPNWDDEERRRHAWERHLTNLYFQALDEQAFRYQRRTDFMGSEYGVGDLIMYAAMSGRCVQMQLAKVLRFTEKGAVRVQPIRDKGSRWGQHYGRDYYVDTRNGKRIDPFASSGKHILTRSHCTCKLTGAVLDDYYYADDGCQMRAPSYSVYHGRGQAGWHGARDSYEYHPIQFQPWVEKRHEESKVTLQITDNIVKWNEPCGLPHAPDHSADFAPGTSWSRDSEASRIGLTTMEQDVLPFPEFGDEK